MHEASSIDPEQRPKLAKTTLWDVGDLVGDPTDTRSNRSDFEELPLTLSATKPMLPRHLFLVHSSDPQSYGKATRNPFWESAM